jgi:hypothetical protein
MNDRQHLELINGTMIYLRSVWDISCLFTLVHITDSMLSSFSPSLLLPWLTGYFQYAGGFEPRKAYDITAKVPGNEPHDPMFIIEAVKSKMS